MRHNARHTSVLASNDGQLRDIFVNCDGSIYGIVSFPPKTAMLVGGDMSFSGAARGMDTIQESFQFQAISLLGSMGKVRRSWKQRAINEIAPSPARRIPAEASELANVGTMNEPSLACLSYGARNP
jgi:hypothetical protein